MIQFYDNNFNLIAEKIHSHMSKKEVALANKVAKATEFLLISEKLIDITDQYNSIQMDLVLLGALLHNCGAKRSAIEEDTCKLFKHRKVIENAINEIKMEQPGKEIFSSQYRDILYMVIESQFGKSTPISQLIPNSGHFGFYVSIACNLVYGGKWNEDKDN